MFSLDFCLRIVEYRKISLMNKSLNIHAIVFMLQSRCVCDSPSVHIAVHYEVGRGQFEASLDDLFCLGDWSPEPSVDWSPDPDPASCLAMQWRRSMSVTMPTMTSLSWMSRSLVSKQSDHQGTDNITDQCLNRVIIRDLTISQRRAMWLH